MPNFYALATTYTCRKFRKFGYFCEHIYFVITKTGLLKKESVIQKNSNLAKLYKLSMNSIGNSCLILNTTNKYIQISK